MGMFFVKGLPQYGFIAMIILIDSEHFHVMAMHLNGLKWFWRPKIGAPPPPPWLKHIGGGAHSNFTRTLKENRNLAFSMLKPTLVIYSQ